MDPSLYLCWTQGYPTPQEFLGAPVQLEVLGCVSQAMRDHRMGARQETALGTAVVCEVQRAAQAKNKTKTQAGCEGRVSGEFV